MMLEWKGSPLPWPKDAQNDLMENVQVFITFQLKLSSLSLLIEKGCNFQKNTFTPSNSQSQSSLWKWGLHQPPSPSYSHKSVIQESLLLAMAKMTRKASPNEISPHQSSFQNFIRLPICQMKWVPLLKTSYPFTMALHSSTLQSFLTALETIPLF